MNTDRIASPFSRKTHVGVVVDDETRFIAYVYRANFLEQIPGVFRTFEDACAAIYAEAR